MRDGTVRFAWEAENVEKREILASSTSCVPGIFTFSHYFSGWSYEIGFVILILEWGKLSSQTAKVNRDKLRFEF